MVGRGAGGHILRAGPSARRGRKTPCPKSAESGAAAMKYRPLVRRPEMSLYHVQSLSECGGNASFGFSQEVSWRVHKVRHCVHLYCLLKLLRWVSGDALLKNNYLSPVTAAWTCLS